MTEKLDIEINPCSDFEMISKLENCLLVIGNSCEEIRQEKEFDKIAVGSRQKKIKIHCILVKKRCSITTSGRASVDKTQLILYCSKYQAMFSRLIKLDDS